MSMSLKCKPSSEPLHISEVVVTPVPKPYREAGPPNQPRNPTQVLERAEKASAEKAVKGDDRAERILPLASQVRKYKTDCVPGRCKFVPECFNFVPGCWFYNRLVASLGLTGPNASSPWLPRSANPALLKISFVPGRCKFVPG